MAAKKTGRPTKYKAEYAEIAERLCFRGDTLQEVADTLGVGLSSIVRWKAAHEDFRNALRAREDADDKVAKSLYQTALDGNVNAQSFWLKNRNPAKWRDKQEHEVDVKGQIAIAMVPLKEL